MSASSMFQLVGVLAGVFQVAVPAVDMRRRVADVLGFRLAAFGCFFVAMHGADSVYGAVHSVGIVRVLSLELFFKEFRHISPPNEKGHSARRSDPYCCRFLIRYRDLLQLVLLEK